MNKACKLTIHCDWQWDRPKRSGPQDPHLADAADAAERALDTESRREVPPSEQGPFARHMSPMGWSGRSATGLKHQEGGGSTKEASGLVWGRWGTPMSVHGTLKQSGVTELPNWWCESPYTVVCQ